MEDTPGHQDEIVPDGEGMGSKTTPLGIYLVATGAIILLILLALSY